MVPETLSVVAVNEDDDIRPLRDPPFNPFRTPRTDRARALVADVLGQLGVYEEYRGLRQRKRQRSAQINYECAVAAIVCDVLRRHLMVPGEWVAQPLSNRYVRKSRYRSSILGNQFSALLDRMTVAEMDFIEVRKGCINPFLPFNNATTIRASKRLITRAEEFDIGIEDFGLDPSEETIVLKHPKAMGAKLRDDRQEYGDTETTRRYRSEMARINSWLDNAAIDCWYAEEAGVNVYDRRLRRIFNERFDRGGRLFGGFWMNMKKHYREGLSLDGDSIAVPDYSQMIASTLYGLAGHPRPERDAYTIPGYEFHREGMKKLFAAMVHSSHELKRFPEDLPETLTQRRS